MKLGKKLKTLYVSRSRTRATQLKEELTLIQWGDRLITEYLYAVKALADEITIIGHSISDDDLTLYVLNGLGPDFQEIVDCIRAWESSLAFEELHDFWLDTRHTYGTWKLRCKTWFLLQISRRRSSFRKGESPVVFQANWLSPWALRLSTRPQLKWSPAWWTSLQQQL